MQPLGLNGKHGRRIEFNTQLPLYDLSQPKLIPFFNRLERLKNLRILSKLGELSDFREISNPIVVAETTGDKL